MQIDIFEILRMVWSDWQPNHGFQPQGDAYEVLLKLAEKCEDINMGSPWNI